MVNLADIERLVFALVLGLDIDVSSENSKRLVSQAGSGDRILIKTGNTISSNSYTKDRIVQYPLDLEFVTQADLDTAIDQIIEKIDEFKTTRVIADLATTYTIEVYTDDISRDFNDVAANDLEGVYGKVSIPNAYYHLLRFKTNLILGTTITDASMKMTSHLNSANFAPFRIAMYGIKDLPIEPPKNASLEDIFNNLTTKVYQDPTLASWNKDTEYTFTTSDEDSINEILVEIMAGSVFDTYIGLIITPFDATKDYQFYAKDIANSNPTKYPVLDIVYNYINEDIFNIRLISAPSSKVGDKFKAQIVLEINQSVT